MKSKASGLLAAHILSGYHCVKSIQTWSFFWSVFSSIRTEYGCLRSKSLYSAQIRENMDKKKLLIWTLFTQRMILSVR